MAHCLKHKGEFSDEFWMLKFKVVPCTKAYSHSWSSCPCAHPGETARRRDPNLFSYQPVLCPNVKLKTGCPAGDNCECAHNVFEQWLHPQRYKALMCTYGSQCTRPSCFFAHSLSELRAPWNGGAPPDADRGSRSGPGSGNLGTGADAIASVSDVLGPDGSALGLEPGAHAVGRDADEHASRSGKLTLVNASSVTSEGEVPFGMAADTAVRRTSWHGAGTAASAPGGGPGPDDAAPSGPAQGQGVIGHPHSRATISSNGAAGSRRGGPGSSAAAGWQQVAHRGGAAEDLDLRNLSLAGLASPTQQHLMGRGSNHGPGRVAGNQAGPASGPLQLTVQSPQLPGGLQLVQPPPPMSGAGGNLAQPMSRLGLSGTSPGGGPMGHSHPAQQQGNTQFTFYAPAAHHDMHHPGLGQHHHALLVPGQQQGPAAASVDEALLSARGSAGGPPQWVTLPSSPPPSAPGSAHHSNNNSQQSVLGSMPRGGGHGPMGHSVSTQHGSQSAPSVLLRGLPPGSLRLLGSMMEANAASMQQHGGTDGIGMGDYGLSQSADYSPAAGAVHVLSGHPAAATGVPSPHPQQQQQSLPQHHQLHRGMPAPTANGGATGSSGSAGIGVLDEEVQGLLLQSLQLQLANAGIAGHPLVVAFPAREWLGGVLRARPETATAAYLLDLLAARMPSDQFQIVTRLLGCLDEANQLLSCFVTSPGQGN